MIELLKRALYAGHKADYVLFDSWFCNPAQLVEVQSLGLNSIGMLKNNSKVHYLFQGEKLTLKEIYTRCRKRRGRSKYLLYASVLAGREKPIPAKLVYIRSKHNKKKWLALICTNPELEEEKIIRRYG